MRMLPVYSKFRTRVKLTNGRGYGSRIIRTITRGGREYQLHATKGWRSYRISK